MSAGRFIAAAWVCALASVAAWALAGAAPAAIARIQDAAVPSANTAHSNAPEPGSVTEAPPAPVQLTAAQEARARALEGELRCPVCRSQSIRQSRSFMADDMRARVRAMIAEGRSDAEIRGYFVDRYGTWVLLTPPKGGFNLAAYLLPALVVVIGAAGLALTARRWSSRAALRAEPTAPLPPSPQLTRLERELEETE